MRAAFLTLIVAGSPALAQAPSAPPPANSASESARAAEAVKIARKAADAYAFTLEGQSETLKLEPNVLLQWSNPVVGSIHGSVFVWTKKGRPEVAASIYKWYGPRNFHLGVEFHSLAAEPVAARIQGSTVWAPGKSGLVFAPIPGAPVPSENPSARLRQLRALAKDFSASQVDREKVPRELRLLTQPIYRYDSHDPAVLDGGLFTFVLGTDPEVFLQIEARRQENGRYAWAYALARMNSVELQVTHQGRVVWTKAEIPWDVVFGHAEPYTVFTFEAGQGLNVPD
jgi:hypothetical protein